MANGTRTRDPQIHNLAEPVANDESTNDLRRGKILRAQGRAQNRPESTPEAVAIDPELAAVVAAWPTLPEAIRRAILAMVEALAVSALCFSSNAVCSSPSCRATSSACAVFRSLRLCSAPRAVRHHGKRAFRTLRFVVANPAKEPAE